ncbi:MAG: hypothetical protein ACR2L0_00110 [Gaiellaceae bacterium]
MASLTQALPFRPGVSRFVLWVAAAPLVLLFARLLPLGGPVPALRLAAAGACVLLLPGALLLRLTGWPRNLGVAAAGGLALSLAVIGFGLLLAFAAGASLALVLAVVALFTGAAVLPAWRAAAVPPVRSDLLAAGGILLFGAAFGALVWWGGGDLRSDALFHLARVRKLDAFDVLSVNAVNEFRDGGPHPGYAFPLWHAALALVARLGGVDPTLVVQHLAAVLTPLALLLAYGAGATLFRSAAGGLAVAAAQLAQLALSRGGTGSFESLALPATVGRILLFPAVLALTFWLLEVGWRQGAPPLVAAGLALAAIHPTYTIFVCVPLAGFAFARLLLAPGDREGLGRLGIALAAIAVPSGLFFAWLLPVVRDTGSYRPGAEQRASGVAHYSTQLDVFGESFRLAPEAITRAGPVVIAALLAIPLAVAGARRRWGSFVLGGSLAVLALLLVPALFAWISDTVSLSQSRRLAAFLPLPFALAGAAFLLARLRQLGVALALGAGLALELLYSAELTYRLQRPAPVWPVWLAVTCGVAALIAGAVLVRRAGLMDRLSERFPLDRRFVALAAAAFVLPVAVGGLASLDTSAETSPNALTPGLLQVLEQAPAGSVVFSQLEPSYEVAAYTPLYVAAAPPGHVADTAANRPYARRRDVVRFFSPRATEDFRRSTLARYDADYLLIDRSRPYPENLGRGFQPVYEDARYLLLNAR